MLQIALIFGFSFRLTIFDRNFLCPINFDDSFETEAVYQDATLL